MLITYWCPSCHALHGEGAVRQPSLASDTVRCATAGTAVLQRVVADDPDDDNYGKPRCRICLEELKNLASPCPECGTPPSA